MSGEAGGLRGRGRRMRLRLRRRIARQAPIPPLRPVPAVPPGPPRLGGSLLRLALALALGYGGLAAGLGYWQVIEAQRLSADPRNPLMLAAARQAPRGSILDAHGELLAHNVGGPGRDPLRAYPDASVAAVIGYKSPIFGTAGLERTFDEQLTGLTSLRPGDEVLRKFRSQPYDPNDVVLSLDVRLQRAAVAALGADRGAVVAIEPQTGRILAMATSPSFDPNRIVDPERGRNYVGRLNDDPASPLLNRATQGLYVPGSVFKIVTAICGLSSGAISPSTVFEGQDEEYETGFLVQGFRIRDAPRSVQTDHPLDFYEATEISSNIWYAHAGLETGPTELQACAQRLGFGERLPFEVPTAASQVTDGNGPYEGFLDQVELANAAYGQGEVLVTPLQMALVAAAVANDGLLMEPQAVDQLRSQSGQVTTVGSVAWGQVMDPSVAAVVTEAMELAVEGRFGRRLAGDAAVPGVPTAGKSGSAELGDEDAPHSWFIGFAPADAPRIAIAVIVERGGHGAVRAVPMAGDLMEQYLTFAP